MLEAGFEALHENVVVPIDGKRVWMNHCPYDAKDERTKLVRPPGAYDVALCRHGHEKWKVCDGLVNVGVDVWNFAPVTLEEILRVRDASE